MKNIFTKAELIYNKIKSNLLLFLFALSIVYIIFLQECRRPEPCPTVTVTEIDTIKHTDTVKIKGDTKYYPMPYEVVKTDTCYVNLSKEDSARIVSDYAVVRKYNLPIINDTNAVINFFADVQFNAIKNYNFDAKYFLHTTVIEKKTVYIEPKKTKVYLGLLGGYQIGSSNLIIAPVATLCTKKNTMYQLGYDPFNKYVFVGLGWKMGKL